jgi:ArsR family transcriptional regulator, arsenate/arsenite/antimonite-responsive transcriptional repressor
VPGRIEQRLREQDLPVEPRLWEALCALADPVRLRIVCLLRQREQCVCHLTSALELSQPTISHHMAILRRAGLVLDRHDASWTYYRLDPAASRSVSKSVASLLNSGLDADPDQCRTTCP